MFFQRTIQVIKEELAWTCAIKSKVPFKDKLTMGRNYRSLILYGWKFWVTRLKSSSEMFQATQEIFETKFRSVESWKQRTFRIYMRQFLCNTELLQPPTVVIIIVVFSYSHEICTVAKSILSCAFLCTWMSKWKFGVKCCQPPKLLQNWFIFLLVLTHSSLMIVKKGIVCKAVPFSGTLKLLHPKTIHKTGIL